MSYITVPLIGRIIDPDEDVKAIDLWEKVTVLVFKGTPSKVVLQFPGSYPTMVWVIQ